MVIFGVWLAQFLASFAAALAANFELRTILYSAPVLSLVGLIFAAVTLPQHSWSYLILGLSAPLVCALCAVLIALFNLGPSWATGWPLAAILVAYDIAIGPLAIVVLFAILRSSAAGEFRPSWSFSMKSLLIFMTAICVLSVALHFALKLHEENSLFATFAVICVAPSVVIAWRFVAGRKKNSPRRLVGG